jgi:hypothetical protein
MGLPVAFATTQAATIIRQNLVVVVDPDIELCSLVSGQYSVSPRVNQMVNSANGDLLFQLCGLRGLFDFKLRSLFALLDEKC